MSQEIFAVRTNLALFKLDRRQRTEIRN